MQQHRNIPAVVNRISVSSLLVAAVAEVRVVPNDRQRNVGATSGILVRDLGRAIRRVIVHHEDFRKLRPQLGRNAIEYPSQRVLRLVGHHQHANFHGYKSTSTRHGCSAWRIYTTDP